MKLRNRCFSFCCGTVVLFLTTLLFCGCSTEIGVDHTSDTERRLYGAENFSADSLNIRTVNLLGNYQLTELFEEDPEHLVRRLEKLYQLNKDTDVIAALADTALQIGYRFHRRETERSQYYLAAAVYSCLYLKHADHKGLYDEQRIRMIRIYNLAATELFCYLKEEGLERAKDFTLSMPGNGRNVLFKTPVFTLPLEPESVGDFTPCANYRTKNLTHDTRVFGVGVPMVADVKEHYQDPVGLTLPGFPIAVTLVMDFHYDFNNMEVSGTLRYVYSRTENRIEIGGKDFPLASDFSTPLAKAADLPDSIHFLRRTLKVEEASDFSGLYLFEPYDDTRIPVVFVHGLMSDMRTWGQMLNTLLHDQEIRKRYQFLGFSYSSGNPIFLSAAMLRKELQNLRKKLIRTGKSVEKFDQMVLVGHSMGGLLSRIQISSCEIDQAAEILGIQNMDQLKKEISAEDLAKAEEIIHFEPEPCIRRVIFISVPHRGSEIARSWVGALGAALIELPIELVKRNVMFLNTLITTGEWKKGVGNNTGIDNLRPDSPTLLLLNSLNISSSVPCHSIIGNRENSFTPGGTDGIVPYWSSHLDQAKSELVVKAGHSTHRVPLAIQEVRQILLLHAGIQRKTITEQAY